MGSDGDSSNLSIFFKCMGLFPLRKKNFFLIIAFILALFISHVTWQLQTWMLM